MKKWRKLPNGQYFNEEKQTFMDYCPVLDEGKKIMTSEGLITLYEYKDFLLQPDETVGIIAAYCGLIEQRKKTWYADFLEFEYILNGKRKISGIWVDFVHDFKTGNAYLLKVIKKKDYPAEIKIIKSFVIKKK